MSTIHIKTHLIVWILIATWKVIKTKKKTKADEYFTHHRLRCLSSVAFHCSVPSRAFQYILPIFDIGWGFFIDLTCIVLDTRITKRSCRIPTWSIGSTWQWRRFAGKVLNLERLERISASLDAPVLFPNPANFMLLLQVVAWTNHLIQTDWHRHHQVEFLASSSGIVPKRMKQASKHLNRLRRTIKPKWKKHRLRGRGRRGGGRNKMNETNQIKKQKNLDRITRPSPQPVRRCCLIYADLLPSIPAFISQEWHTQFDILIFLFILF